MVAVLDGTETFVCAKCRGEGELPECGRFADGRCFRCNGTGRMSATALMQVLRPMLGDDLVRRRAEWVLSATADDWSRASARQVRAIEKWIEFGPLRGWIVMPVVGEQRLDEVLDSMVKPF